MLMIDCKIASMRAMVSLCLSSTLMLGSAAPSLSQGRLRDQIKQRFSEQNKEQSGTAQRMKIAGLNVAFWSPKNVDGPKPLVIFSHGFHGSNMQSKFLMEALASAGYLVIAPNHQDAMVLGNKLGKSEENFAKPANWSEQTYIDRKNDIFNLIEALHKDSNWNSKIDWSKLALAGHSLGGYTVLGLAGAWPSWKLPGVKAVLALSPYCTPYISSGNLAGLKVPVMYQGGTRDMGITPFVKGPQGAYSKTSAPAYFVDFEKAGHFAWSNLVRDQTIRENINYYCLSFLDKYLRNDAKANPTAKRDGVVDIEFK